MATFGTFVGGQVLTAAELNAAGTWSSYTPTFTQSATITKTTNWARYTQFNKLVIGSIKMTASSAGTANNKVIVGLPVSASSNNFVMGTMTYVDVSDAAPYSYVFSIPVFYESSVTMSFGPATTDTSFAPQGVADVRFGQNYSTVNGVTIASGDIIQIQFMYEAA